MSLARVLVTSSVLALLTACPEQKPVTAEVKDAGGPAPKPRKVTVLVTGHETGLLPLKASRLLADWSKQHGWPDAVALSTGDMFSGSALSSRFFGEPTAEAMKAMQYKAAALGNHDLDLGLDTLQKFRASSGLVLLAANLKDKADAEQPLKIAPYTVVEKSGVKVGVIGLTSPKTIGTTVAGRSSGLELVPIADAMPAAIAGATKDGAEVLVVVADDCFGIVQKEFEAHADWKVDLVVGGRCEGASEAKVRDIPFFSIGDDLSFYVSAAFELSAGAPKKLTAARRELAEKGEEDADMKTLRERWQKKLDEELGQVIGFTKNGIKADAPQLRTLVATALKDEAKADAALINQKGIREGLPKGAITRASVYSMIPFENAVLTVKVKGDLLKKFKASPEAFVVLPPKLEGDKEYLLVTTEYLYFGGDGLGFEMDAPNPELTGQVWQTPVIEWLARRASSAKSPLEKMLK